MRKVTSMMLSVALVIAFSYGSAMATQPGQNVNPNGFPSGEHYNLNIIGKKDGFTCPEQEYDLLGNPVYGNVVFVPEKGVGIQLLMQSGTGKKAAAIPTLQVLDPCTATIDGDAALLQLPKNDAGYRVYARALAKPTDNPFMTIEPDLVAVVDEFGNDLIYLGLVTSNGFETPYVSFTRTTGKSRACDITGLFEWSGDVCYFTAPTGESTAKTLCCTGADANGVYESCTVKEEDAACLNGAVEVTAYCKTYLDEWVFNIGDFVTYLWSLDNSGVRLLQVRFYPVK